MNNNIINIFGNTINPGERKEILLPMPSLYDGSPLYSHIHVINGKKPGPVLCLTAAIHGDELNGVEIINKVLSSKKLKDINGTLIAVPVVNVYGFLYQQRYLMDRRDLNRFFPGDSRGSLASKIANLFYENVFKQSTHIVDFHTGSLHRVNFPQIRAVLDDDYMKSFAKSFGAPIILNSSIRAGSLRAIAHKHNKPLLVYEAGESLRFDSLSIKYGIHGVFNVMHFLGMLDKKYKDTSSPVFCESSVWIRAKYSGFFIKENDILGHVTNPMSLKNNTIISPISGFIIGINNNALVHDGGAIFNIALLNKINKKQIRTLELLDSDEMDNLNN